MKVKLDDYEVRVLINGLVQQHRSYDAETNGQIDALALRLCDIAEAMKPGRKKKIPFEPVEIRVIRHCLVDWRNREISQGNDVASEVIGELLLTWDSLTQNFEYSNLGAIKSLSDLSEKLSAEFE